MKSRLLWGLVCGAAVTSDTDASLRRVATLHSGTGMPSGASTPSALRLKWEDCSRLYYLFKSPGCSREKLPAAVAHEWLAISLDHTQHPSSHVSTSVLKLALLTISRPVAPVAPNTRIFISSLRRCADGRGSIGRAAGGGSHRWRPRTARPRESGRGKIGRHAACPPRPTA